ncbi:hypothetical protein [Campylobacter sp.]|uniref:hypothetical protein n=1 Tax=Campylobacter sp. TaxID=205 RepID=UPI0026DB281B|nr:hypothetical protein [Campylobacter sp.]MDO4674896.1 hypothetical protein [Campylobacter sp.]
MNEENRAGQNGEILDPPASEEGTPLTPGENSVSVDFRKELKALLGDNTKWLEQVNLSLLAVSHMYESFLKLDEDYRLASKKCDTTLQAVVEHYQNIKAKARDVEANVAAFEHSAQALSERMSEKSARFEEILEDVEYLKHEIDVYYTEIEKFRAQLEFSAEDLDNKKDAILSQLQAFRAEISQSETSLRGLISQAEEDLNTKRAEFQALRSDSLDEFRDLATQKAGEITSAKNEALDALEAKKNELLEGMTENFDNSEMMTQLENKRTEIENFGHDIIRRFEVQHEKYKSIELSFDKVIEVGYNHETGQFASLHEALNEAAKFRRLFKTDQRAASVKVELQEGWEWNEPLVLVDVDLSGIVIAQKNPNNPIMVDFSQCFRDRQAVKCFIYLENSSLNIDSLNLKAKSYAMSESGWQGGLFYTRLNSSVTARNLRLDITQITKTDNNAFFYPFYFDDNTRVAVEHKIELVSPSTQAVDNGVLVGASSSAYIGQVSIHGNCGHNGVLVNVSSSAYIGQVSIHGNCGHNGVLVGAASRLISWGRDNDFTRFTSGNKHRTAVGMGSVLQMHVSVKNGGNSNERATNIAENTPTLHGIVNFFS